MSIKTTKYIFLISALIATLFMGLWQPNAQADTYDDQCATAAAGNGGLTGFGRFASSVVIPAGGTGTVTFRTYVCNGTNDTISRDFTLTSGTGCIGPAFTTCNALDYSTTGWGFSGGFWQQDMGSFAPHTWRSKDVSMTINGSAFGGSGWYTVRVQGKGRIWNQTQGCTYPANCYVDTNVVNIDLQLYVQRPTVTCSVLELNPSNPKPGDDVEVTMKLQVGTGQIDRTNYPLSIVLDPPTGPDQPFNNVAYTPSPASGPVSISYQIPTIANAPPGEYRVTGTLSGPSWFTPVVCSTTFRVAERPFFIARGGDVATGITTTLPGCTGWGVGSGSPVILNAWNRALLAGGDPNIGAGTNLAAFSFRLINGFASAQNRTSPSPPKDLSFSNQTFSSFGGTFLNAIPCPSDYYGTLPAGTATIAGSINPNSIGNNVRYANTGSLTVQGTGFIPIGWTASGPPNGNRPIIYVNGDAYISGSIQLYAGATTIAQLPNFYLVVKGNIYIAPNVTRLDGVYVAQPILVDSNVDGDFNDPGENTKGNIYTCAYPVVAGVSWRAPSQTELNDSTNGCKKNLLTVNGAFIAKELKLYRSFGDLGTGVEAEKFNTTPSTWLATPCAILVKCGGFGSEPYDAITSLPPVL